MCFCALFSLLNVEEVYNEQSPCCNCNSLTSHLPSCTVPLWGGPARSSPLYQFGIGAISEVLAKPAPCEMSVRSTQIRGAVSSVEGACGDLP